MQRFPQLLQIRIRYTDYVALRRAVSTHGWRRPLKRSRQIGGAVVGSVVVTALAAALFTPAARSADDLELEPIEYSKTAPQDTIARLQERIDKGEVTLQYDPVRGYLPAVLHALGIHSSSQTLVFSKTSFQRNHISPQNPRALYFNDQAYIGWVRGAPVVELSTVDPQLGTVFYTLDQQPSAKPKFLRQTYECLSCHASTMTRGIPGHVMRSVFAGPDGNPFFQAGTFQTTDESPLKERWGGWYVTGTVGNQQHMGNRLFRNAEDAEAPNLAPTSNLTTLKGRLDTTDLLSPHSDVVALMVMEHQTNVQNLIARATYEARRGLHYQTALNRGLGRPEDELLESTTGRIRSVGEPLVRALLLAKEAPLTAPIKGTSTFAADFQSRGPRDGQGRSLRDLDLTRRLFRYPCSYLVYSPEFDAMPPLAKQYVYRRLREILTGKDTSTDFATLTPADRQAILAILTETKPDFAASGT